MIKLISRNIRIETSMWVKTQQVALQLSKDRPKKLTKSDIVRLALEDFFKKIDKGE